MLQENRTTTLSIASTVRNVIHVEVQEDEEDVDRFKCISGNSTLYMSEDLSDIYQAVLEDERKRRYLKEIGDWLVEEYFVPYQAS